MVVIVGSTHDDVLYFDKVLFNRREEVVFNRFTISIGTIFNQEIIVVGEQYSSVLTSAVLTYILNKYYVDLVVVVGKCFGVDKSMKNGDLVISTRIINVDADFTRFGNIGLGEIPGFAKDYKVQNDLIGYMRQGVAKRTYISAHNAVFLSSDNLSDQTFNRLKENKSLFGISDEKFVIDHNTSGAAMACYLRDVPLIAVKVVENQFDMESKIDHYLKVLDKYIDLGKAVVSTIGDISRNDVLRS